MAFNFQKVSRCSKLFCNPISLACSKRLHLFPVLLTNKNNNDSQNDSEVPSLQSSRYEPFSEENAPVIFDIVEERNKIKDIEKDNFYDEFKGINLERGVTGVFDVEELVDILRKEKAQDIFVAALPREFRYADYMIVVTGRSNRHMIAMCEYIRKIFKRKRSINDHIPMIEGKNSKDWIALDLGNIVLHVFEKTSRELYDLETLWSVGREYDSQFKNKESSSELVINYEEIIASLTPNT